MKFCINTYSAIVEVEIFGCETALILEGLKVMKEILNEWQVNLLKMLWQNFNAQTTFW